LSVMATNLTRRCLPCKIRGVDQCGSNASRSGSQKRNTPP
jgi:hypothetical protein